MADEFQYDVAFSFVKDDEALATRLSELLAPRVKVFLYSRRQEVIAGTDGELTFNRVFSADSRTVAVLYRSTWGTTPWTRIEETAIRNRAYDDGYDFVLFIPVEKSVAVPAWLPKTRIWIGLDRWGIEGAASVIEARIQEAGGVPHEETVADRAAAVDRERILKKARNDFEFSQAAVNSARAEVVELLKRLKEACIKVSETSTSFQLEFALGDSGLAAEVRASRYKLFVSWIQQWANILEHSELYVRLQRFDSPFNGTDVRERHFHFTLLSQDVTAWSERSGGKSFSTAKLVEEVLDLLLHELKNERSQ
jgi:hypothetical protein